MKKTLLFLTLTIIITTFSTAQAEEISIVDVKRNITMSDEETVYKDFYINAGTSSGLKKNQVLNVKRRITVRGVGQKITGDFENLVGQIRIIQVSDTVSVAREYKLFPRDQEPMLDQTGIMTGDRIEVAGSFVDDKYPKKTVSVDNSAEGVGSVGVTDSAGVGNTVGVVSSVGITTSIKAETPADSAIASSSDVVSSSDIVSSSTDAGNLVTEATSKSSRSPASVTFVK